MRHDLPAGKKKKKTRWVVLGNGDVPLDEIAFFYDWIDYINRVTRMGSHIFGILRVGKLG